MSDFQVMPPLSADEYEALKADIKAHGVRVPVDVDENDRILDGHHRVRVCDELGIDYPTRRVTGLSEDAKRDHAFIVNMCRRHLGPVQWAEAFKRLAEARGVQLGKRGRKPNGNSVTVTELAAEVGVSQSTARRRLRDAGRLDGHSDLVEQVLGGEIDLHKATYIASEREKVEQREREATERAERLKQAQLEGSVGVWDMWTSPRRWLLYEAKRAEQHYTIPKEPRFYFYAPLLATEAERSAEIMPDEITDNPAAMDAFAAAHELNDQLRRHVEETEVALHRQILEHRRAIAEPLRKAAELADDVPTIFLGRESVYADGGGAIRADACNWGLIHDPNMHIAKPHELEGCRCEEAER
jgi:ParB-like chromosome segregation protein Spo0J